jgi:uncharacterized protein
MSNPLSGASRVSMPQPHTRRQALLGIIVIVILLAITTARAIARWYTDYLWFSEDVGYASVWRTIWGAKIALGFGFGLLFAALMWINLRVAQNHSPLLGGFSSGQVGLDRLAETVEHRQGIVRLLVSGVLALFAGPAMAGQWQDWLLFRNGSSIGVRDSQFGKDLSLYFFRLPFVSALVSWLFATIFVVLLVTAAWYVLSGAIHLGEMVPRTTQAVKVHISLLIAVLALLKAVAYWINRYELTLSSNGVVSGASYTDVKARIPALALLSLVSVTVAVLMLVNSRRQGWALAGVAVAVWVVVSIVAGTVYPSILQAIVKSNQLDREQKFIERNIAATNIAMGLTSVKRTNLDIRASDGNVTQSKLSAAEQTALQNLRIWEPTSNGSPPSDIAEQAFVKLQQNIDVYGFEDIDIDRYVVNGKVTPVALGVREIAEKSENISSWVQQRLVNTHGSGLVIAGASVSDTKGAPVFLSDGQDSSSAFSVKQPRVYFGEGTSRYVVAATKSPEVDGKEQTSSYAGRGGVQLSSFFRRFAYTLRFADWNLLISSQIKTTSRILATRKIVDRANKLAPFFRYDSDPYPVLFKGKIVWVLDAYTTTTRFPYGQTFLPESFTSSNGLYNSFNYVRNPVKVIVDAYDGTMQFFLFDPGNLGVTADPKSGDPLVKAIAATYPSLLRSTKDLDRLYPGLRAHFRYPEELFQVQSQMIGSYQVKDPSVFYRNTARWDLSRAPADKLEADPKDKTSVPGAGPGVVAPSPRRSSMRPYYLLSSLPGSQTQHFFLQSNLVAFSTDFSQQNLRGILVARSDPGEYGQLELYTLPAGAAESGPRQVSESMGSDRRISEKENLLGQGGSSIFYGSVQVLPIAKNMLYVRPFFVKAGSGYPIFTFMSVSYRGTIGFGANLSEALSQVGLSAGEGGLKNQIDTSGGKASTASSGSKPSRSAVEVLAQVSTALIDAQAALDRGDLATYQKKVDEARALASTVLTETVKVGGTQSSDSASSAKSTDVKPNDVKPTNTGAAANSGTVKK